MAHCKAPQSCSVCLATPFSRVEVRDGVTYVDGVASRPADPGSNVGEKRRASSRRGAANARLGTSTGAGRKR